MKSLRALILIVSTFMFLYQLYTAILLLVDPPTIDSSSEIDIQNIDLPLITICTIDQYQRNKKSFQELGFGNRVRSIRGELEDDPNTKTWGNINKTYDEVLYTLYDEDIDKTIKIKYGDESDFTGNYTRVFIPAYGFCSEIYDFNPKKEILIKVPDKFKSKVEGFRVFITDRNFRSYFSPDYSSHRGEMAFNKKMTYSIFDIDVSIRSNCEVKPTMKLKETFEGCVDDELQKQVTGTIGCSVPWMSGAHQCNNTYPANFTDSLPGFYYNITDPPYWLKALQLESDCKLYCSATTSTLTARSTKGKV